MLEKFDVIKNEEDSSYQIRTKCTLYSLQFDDEEKEKIFLSLINEIQKRPASELKSLLKQVSSPEKHPKVIDVLKTLDEYGLLSYKHSSALSDKEISNSDEVIREKDKVVTILGNKSFGEKIKKISAKNYFKETVLPHIDGGIYHYRSDTNFLETIKKGEFMQHVSSMVQAKPYIDIHSSSAVIFITGVVERQLIKYGERAYRLMLQESGFVSHIISLIAEIFELRTCWVGGYLDDKINDFIGIDCVFETIHNVIVIGKKQESENSK